MYCKDTHRIVEKYGTKIKSLDPKVSGKWNSDNLLRDYTDVKPFASENISFSY